MRQLRHVAPAGAPIGVGDLVRAAGVYLSRSDPSDRLRQAFVERFGVRHCFLTSTGRAGMVVLLRALSNLAPHRRDVIVPSYTCYSVAASVVKAGLRPRIVDISPDTLDYELDELRAVNFRSVLAIVATNLYGLPNDLAALQMTAREHGVFLVDDAAQALGAAIDGRACGTWGDAGLFSLDKGKNVSAIDGGVLVAHEDSIAEAIEREWRTLGRPTGGETLAGVAKAAVYSVMLRPWLYWIPERIPQIGLGQTVFTLDFPLNRPPVPLTALGAVMMRRLDEFTRVRVANAAAVLEGLRMAPGIRTIAPRRGASPAYLRLPILAVDERARVRTITALRSVGLGATASYPAALADVPGLQPYLADPAPRTTGGRDVARRIVTLPTHPLVSSADVARTIEVVTTVAESGSAQAPHAAWVRG